MTSHTIRPTALKYRELAFGAGAVATVAVVAGVVEFRDYLPQIVIGTALLLVVGVVCVALFFRNTKVVLEPGQVSHTNMVGYTKRIAAGSVSSVVLVHNFIVLVSLRTRTRRSDAQVFLLDPSGATLLRVRSALWGAESIALVRAAVPAVPETEHDTMEPGTMRGAYPRSIGFFEANPIVVGTLAAIAVVAVVAAVIVAIMVSRS